MIKMVRAVADPGPSFIFRPNWGLKGQKNFLRPSPPPTHLIWRSGSATVEPSQSNKSLRARLYMDWKISLMTKKDETCRAKWDLDNNEKKMSGFKLWKTQFVKSTIPRLQDRFLRVSDHQWHDEISVFYQKSQELITWRVYLLYLA